MAAFGTFALARAGISAYAVDLSASNAVLGTAVAEDTGQAYIGARIYKRRHPHWELPRSKRVKNSYGFRTRPAGPFSSPAKGRPLTTTVTPSPKRHRGPNMPFHKSSTIPHVMGDKSHGSNEMHTEDDVKVQYNQLRCGELYYQRIVLPPLSADNDDQNARDCSIFLKGLKVHREWYANASNAANAIDGYVGPMIINWALIQWNCPIAVDQGGDKKTELLSRFFTDYNDPTKFHAPFNEYPTSGPLLGTEFDMKHIDGNMSDKNDYRILARRRKMFRQFLYSTGGIAQGTTKTTARIKEYFKMPQRVYLEGGDEYNWSHPIWEIWWVTPQNPLIMAKGWTTTPGQVCNHYTSYNRHTTYYKEIKH
ncbi:putative capsid protein [Naiadivirus wakense]|uniref:Capsid protein n=1 Tax=Circoviridae sp. TaxID=1954248 RepID=A0ABY4CGK1_9VIRU|nr:putative capsid protein [Circoviridae sp.]